MRHVRFDRAARPYRPPISEQSESGCSTARGSQLSGELVDLFLDLFDRELVGHLGHLNHGGACAVATSLTPNGPLPRHKRRL